MPLPYERTSKERSIISEIPTSHLHYPEPVPDTTPVIEATHAGWTLYRLAMNLKKATGGYDSLHAELNSHGSGRIYRADTSKTWGQIPFAITWDEIVQLYSAGKHARGDFDAPQEPPEGA